MTLRALVCLFTLSVLVFAQAPAASKKASRDADKEIRLGEDEPGCKDSALMPRIAGCSIIQCDVKESDSIDIQIGVSTEGAIQKEEMDGESEVLYYLCPSKISAGQITKNAEAILTKSGFKTVYSGKDGDEQPIVTALKETQWVQVSTYAYNEYSAYILSAVKVTPESQAPTEAMSEEMAKNGRVVLHSIPFGSQQFDLPAEADKILSEVAAFLVRQPELKVRVEGHTAEAADAASNVTLSKQRASRVASWLLEHGIDKTRLTIEGAGDTKPEAGGEKSKNSRIEIVKL